MKCSGSACGCSGNNEPSGWARRDFLKALGLSTGTLAFSHLQVMAGPFSRSDFERLVPADKKLHPDWLKSLTARGERTVYRGADLQKIGMPVGGICAGQLYLGGDGKLWHWDIFNQNASTDATHYANPMQAVSPVDQGFAIRVVSAGKTEVRPLDQAHWREVSFIGEYPIGYVEYSDPASAVGVSLEAFSPFVPLNTEDSSLPATVLEFTVRNNSSAEVEAELAGWLQNAVCLYSAQVRNGFRRNRLIRENGLLFLECSAQDAPSSAPAARPDITVTNHPQNPPKALAQEGDFGTMGLGLLEPQPNDFGRAALAAEDLPSGAFSTQDRDDGPVERPFRQQLLGVVGRKLKLAPGASAKATFVLAWHFPNAKLGRLPPRRYYATRFNSAQAVAEYVTKEYVQLSSLTRLWQNTWYDSTLPYWFLDRTFLNTCILASSTCYRFEGGRFYGWEGVGCCKGTCGHVWHYAHAVARLFPDLERITREKVDFGLALQPDGAIHFRGEFNNFPAIDAQAGTILRTLREHQMSANDGFLKRNWPRIKRATEWLIAKDGNGDGLIEGNQHNTLDADWYGPVAWLSGLYLAALLAAETMALEIGDQQFAQQCRNILERGQKNIVTELFDDGYFINKPDPSHAEAVNSGTGCEIDQVFGQHWAFQVGLPRVFPEKETRSALESLWRYNFTPDVGPYRQANKPGRWYAMPGEAGLLMCTFPRSDWDYTKAKGKGQEGVAGYFNECMNGFEYQAAGHMIWEGMTTEGLAVTRAVHDRYHASRRNPWNEVECGDHYARSMASYGIFLAVCGFEYHGPKGHLGFAPRLTSSDPSAAFKSAFTTAEGWGSFSQKSEGGGQRAEIQVKYGKLRLNTLALPATTASGNSARVLLDQAPVAASFARAGERVLVSLSQPTEIKAGQTLTVLLG